MAKNRPTPTDLWDPYWAKDGSDDDEPLALPDPATGSDQLGGGLQEGSTQPSGGAFTAPAPITTVGPQGEERPYSAAYIPNTYNGKPTVGANMGGDGLSSGARFLEQYVETPFNQKGFRQTGSATEYDPSKDQMARSVVDGVVVPRQVGAPIQIDPKYGGGVGTVTNPFSSSMGATAPAAPSFAAPPERQPITPAATPATATPAMVTPAASVVRRTMEARPEDMGAVSALGPRANETPATNFLSRLDGLKEWSRSRGGGLQTGGVQSSNGLGGGPSDVNTLARRLQANERFAYKVASAEARRRGVRGRVPRSAFGLGGGTYGDYAAEAQDRLTSEEDGSKTTQANNALLKSFLEERLRSEKQRNDVEAARLEAVRAQQGLRK